VSRISCGFERKAVFLPYLCGVALTRASLSSWPIKDCAFARVICKIPFSFLGLSLQADFHLVLRLSGTIESPTGMFQIAQGCALRATLGIVQNKVQPQRGCVLFFYATIPVERLSARRIFDEGPFSVFDGRAYAK
jgi:hypothetical protein